MAAALELDAATERVAVNLLRHLEWQSEGFSLVFLFADVGPSIRLAEWLNQHLHPQGRPLRIAEAGDDFVQQPEAAVDALMSRCIQNEQGCGSIWYTVQRHSSDERWNRARRLFLARLNERRFLLERDMKYPLVLVLPADFRADTRNIAPDIWHVRALSEELRAALPTIPAGQSASAFAAAMPSALLPKSGQAEQLLPAYEEWSRMMTGGSMERAYLPTGWRAVSELLSAGRPADAQDVAQTIEAEARRRLTANPTVADLRNLLLSLDEVGRVAQALGDWAQAETVYTESLKLSRQLVERLGGSPESLRDLLVVLNKVGRAAEARGDWMQAEAVYSESLLLCRQLFERLGGTPESLRDLSVSLALIGRSAQARGNWKQAGAVYGESLALSRQLVERLGDTPESLRDLSVSLDDVGWVARVRGDWMQAEGAYGESLVLRRQLVERLGGTPESLRDLSVSLDNVGGVARARGDWAQAEAAYGESLALCRQLVERLGGTPESLEDLGFALQNLANLPSGNSALRAEAEHIFRSLAARFPMVERYRRSLAALGGSAAGEDSQRSG